MKRIIKLEGTKIRTFIRKRVAAYARVSSDKDTQLHSLSAQISYYNSYIGSREDWEFAGVYADEALTGTKDNRPEFQRMLQDCRDGKIDMIITKSITRFARNTVTLLAAYAQEESYNVSENQKWRIRRMFERGRPNTGRMLGYRLKDGVLQIVPEEAEIVKMIFNDYLSGMGRNLIVKKLIRMGVPTLSGGQCRESTVLGILTNEKYTGDMLLQKTYSIDHISKKKAINHGEKRMYYVEHSHEPIIDKETFTKVQQELARRAEKFPNTAQKAKEYPFTGLIRCGFCGKYFRRKITASGTKYAKPVWICPTFNTYGKDICSAQQIPEKILIEKTSEVLGTADWDRETLLSYVSEIWVPEHNLLIYVFRDGHTEEVAWQNPSRRESWSDKMKQSARERQLRVIERRRKDDGTD